MEKLPIILEEKSSSIKLIIPAYVENKIRRLCSEISTTEWSGVLFYTTKGTYEKDLVVTCEDILLMDVGTATYTEFNMSPEVIAYMAEHPESLDYQQGLIHSHNNMSTFFSGTDKDTLQKEGNDRNHFVSLIVNNEGTYTAAITRKLNEIKEVKCKYTFNSFDNEINEGEYIKSLNEDVILYTIMDIEKHSIQDFTELNSRIKEIKERKQRKNESLYQSPESKIKPTVASLFDDYNNLNSYQYDFNSNNNDNIDKTVRAIVLQLLTGSITISGDNKIKPSEWVNKMVNLFGNRFEDDSMFESFMELFIEFVFTSYCPVKQPIGFDEQSYVSMLATEVLKELEKLKENKYLRIIKQNIEIWIY